MRDIEFRGQRVDNKEWVYGYLSMHTIKECDEGLKHYPHISFIDKELSFYVSVNVIPETVGQYTGLTDKNGTKIFEGDVVHIAIWGKFEKPISEENSTVVFENGRFGIYRGVDWHLTSFDSFCDTTFEVIGNIHDNPELLKGGASV